MDYLRIKKNAEFSKLFKKGKRVFSPALSLIYYPSRQAEMGIALSKKHGKAVTRNRIKRLLREIYRKNHHLLGGNYSVILMPRPAEEHGYGELEKSMICCFDRVNRCESSKKV